MVKFLISILFFAFLATVCILQVQKNINHVTNLSFSNSPYRCARTDASSVSTHSFEFVLFRSEAHPIYSPNTMRNNTNPQPYEAHPALPGLWHLAEIQLNYKPKNTLVAQPDFANSCFSSLDVANLAYEVWPEAELVLQNQLMAVYTDRPRKIIAYRMMGHLDQYEPQLAEHTQLVAAIAYNTYAERVTLVMNQSNGQLKPDSALQFQIERTDELLRLLGVHMDDFIILGPCRTRYYSYLEKEEGTCQA